MRKLMGSPKILLALLAFVVCASSSDAQTINVTQSASDFGFTSNTVKNITMTPIAPAGDYQGTYLLAQPIQPSYFTNGSGVFSNLVSGYAYKVNFQTLYNATYRTNFFSSGLSNNVNGHDYTGYVLGFAKDGSVITFAYQFGTNSSGGTPIAAGTGISIVNTGGTNVISATGSVQAATNLTWGATYNYTSSDRPLSLHLYVSNSIPQFFQITTN